MEGAGGADDVVDVHLSEANLSDFEGSCGDGTGINVEWFWNRNSCFYIEKQVQRV